MNLRSGAALGGSPEPDPTGGLALTTSGLSPVLHTGGSAARIPACAVADADADDDTADADADDDTADGSAPTEDDSEYAAGAGASARTGAGSQAQTSEGCQDCRLS